MSPAGLGTAIPIELDKPRTLRLNLWAVHQAELELGKIYNRKISLLALMTRGELGITDMLVLVWQGLRHEDKGLTLEQVGTMLDMADFAMVMGKVNEAWNAAQGPATESANGEASDNAPLASTGAGSGVEAATTSASAMTSSGD